MSNTATAAMLVPIAAEVVRKLPTNYTDGDGQSSSDYIAMKEDQQSALHPTKEVNHNSALHHTVGKHGLKPAKDEPQLSFSSSFW
jgi:hypothetical protein